MKFSVESLQFNIDDEEGGVNAEVGTSPAGTHGRCTRM